MKPSRRKIVKCLPELRVVLELLQDLPRQDGRATRSDPEINREFVEHLRNNSITYYNRILDAAGRLLTVSPEQEFGFDPNWRLDVKSGEFVPSYEYKNHFVMATLNTLWKAGGLLRSLVELRDELASMESRYDSDPSEITIGEWTAHIERVGVLKERIKDSMEIKIFADGSVRAGLELLKNFDQLNISRLRKCAECPTLFWAYRSESSTCSKEHANAARVRRFRENQKARKQDVKQ